MLLESSTYIRVYQTGKSCSLLRYYKLASLIFGTNVVQGSPTIVLGIFTLFLLPDRPGTSSFIDDAERVIALDRANRGTSGDVGYTINKGWCMRASNSFSLLTIRSSRIEYIQGLEGPCIRSSFTLSSTVTDLRRFMLRVSCISVPMLLLLRSALFFQRLSNHLDTVSLKSGF